MILLVTLAILSVVGGTPTPQNTISYVFENGTVITEDLDKPVAVTYTANINKQRFFLYTQANKDTGCQVNVNNIFSLILCGFDATLPTRFLVHGWQSDYESESVQVLKNAYLAKGKYNIFICDYKVYNQPYILSVILAKSIGANIGTFIQNVINFGLPATDIFILGHSLGAHVSGFAGQSLKSKGILVNTIVGLDAAGPLFDINFPADRLSSDDAANVQCSHTSRLLGMTNPCGTSDFYPNGGSNQPSCQQAIIPGFCDHAASYRYHAASIADEDTYPAFSCKSVSEAQNNKKALTECEAANIYMGEAALRRPSTGIYYVAI